MIALEERLTRRSGGLTAARAPTRLAVSAAHRRHERSRFIQHPKVLRILQQARMALSAAVLILSVSYAGSVRRRGLAKVGTESVLPGRLSPPARWARSECLPRSSPALRPARWEWNKLQILASASADSEFLFIQHQI
jgi:hypothetical protein